jgi:hypothetical protein
MEESRESPILKQENCIAIILRDTHPEVRGGRNWLRIFANVGLRYLWC